MNGLEAIQEFRRLADAKRVFNSRTQEFGGISVGDRDIIISAATRGMIAASGNTDLSSVDYRKVADKIATCAKEDLERHGLSDGVNVAARCRRFVCTVDQKSNKRRNFRGSAPPPRWKELGDAILAKGHPRRHLKERTDHRYADLIRLAIAVAPKIEDPCELPDKNQLADLLLGVDGINKRKLKRFLNAYRAARRWAMELGSLRDYPDVDRCPVRGERGLRSLPDIVTRLEEAGCTSRVDELSQEEVIRLLAPLWYKPMMDYLAKWGRSPSKRKKVLEASSRMLAELARTGKGDLSTAHPTQMLLVGVETGEAVTGSLEEEAAWAAPVISAVGEDDLGGGDAADTRKVVLLEYLAYEGAVVSSANSPLYDMDDPEAVFWTATVQSDVQTVGDLAVFTGPRTATFQKHSNLAGLAKSNLQELRDKMKEENEQRRLSGHKAKEKILELVTYPMMLFIGLPALRKRALLLQAQLKAAMELGDPREVRRATEAYDDALRDYTLFVVFHLDGLRVANYTHARLGPATRDAGMVIQQLSDGTIVRSYTHIHPIFGNDGRLARVETCFFGDDDPRVKLKVAHVPGSAEWRRRPHWLRTSLVDLDLFAEYLTVVRPRHLAAQGLIASVEAYDIAKDISEQHFALFVSPETSTDPYAAVTGAYALGTIGATFGRTLHWICTTVLGRKIPEYGSKALQDEYPRVFGPHAARLEAGTYVNGVRKRTHEACVLLNDTKQVVDNRYTVIEASMVNKQGWEAMHFFDDLYDRTWDQNELIDWTRFDPFKGLPKQARPPGLAAVSLPK